MGGGLSALIETKKWVYFEVCMQSSFLVVPHITVYDEVVNEGVGMITVRFNRTGGDLSVGSRIRASTRDSPGTYVSGEISIEKVIKSNII